jgi:signal transduction histidine kinase
VNVTFDDLVSDVRRILSGPDGPIALALALGLGAIVETFLYAADPGERASCLIANLLATLPLVFWRTRLPWVAGVVTFASLVAVASNPTLLTLSGVTAQLSSSPLVANRYRRRWSVLLAAPFSLAASRLVGRGLARGRHAPRARGRGAGLGDSRRQRSQAIAERDATRHAMAETQRDQVIMEERARIARELHDVVAHHVSVIAVQAETARLTTPEMPEEGKERLAAIGQTARDSLTELRRLLGVLRADGSPEAARSPQPGLGRLAELIDSARTAGTPVRLRLEGDGKSTTNSVRCAGKT